MPMYLNLDVRCWRYCRSLRRAILDSIRKTLRSNQMPGDESIVGWYRSIDWH
jgi:hypothetical protein